MRRRKCPRRKSACAKTPSARFSVYGDCCWRCLCLRYGWLRNKRIYLYDCFAAAFNARQISRQLQKSCRRARRTCRRQFRPLSCRAYLIANRLVVGIRYAKLCAYAFALQRANRCIPIYGAAPNARFVVSAVFTERITLRPASISASGCVLPLPSYLQYVFSRVFRRILLVPIHSPRLLFCSFMRGDVKQVTKNGQSASA